MSGDREVGRRVGRAGRFLLQRTILVCISCPCEGGPRAGMLVAVGGEGWLMVCNLTVKSLLTAASGACVLSALFLPSNCGGEMGTHRKALKKRFHSFTLKAHLFPRPLCE